ncbi:MAG TPA: hypothetical protein V6D20_12215 [Candidatus Obscuribacterales bacterium]
MLLRSFVIWLVFILAESLNGIARSLWLVPSLGNSLAHRVSFAIGSLLILIIATVFVPWLRASRVQSLGIGLLWAGLTLAFEVGLGRWVLDYSWTQIWADYDVFQGALMPLGLGLMVLSPIIGGIIRSRFPYRRHPA